MEAATKGPSDRFVLCGICRVFDVRASTNKGATEVIMAIAEHGSRRGKRRVAGAT